MYIYIYIYIYIIPKQADVIYQGFAYWIIRIILNYPDNPVGKTKVDYLYLFVYYDLVLLRVLSTLTFQLRSFCWYFFFWLGIVEVIDNFPPVGTFLAILFY